MVKKAASRIYLAVIFLFLYLPILVLVVLSFNNSKSRVVWGGFTLKWYASCFTDKTIIKYKMKINCHDNCYSAEVSNIVYQYDPQNNKKFKTYSAESVIANNGKSNTVALIKDPKLFCNATFFFVENLFADILDAVNDAEL